MIGPRSLSPHTSRSDKFLGAKTTSTTVKHETQQTNKKHNKTKQTMKRKTENVKIESNMHGET